MRNVDQAVDLARQSFVLWSRVALDERKKFLLAYQEKLTVCKNDLALLISEETGKPYWESLTEVQAMINKIPISFKAYEEFCHEVEAPFGSATRHTRFKPHGVVAVLGPFNLPAHLPNGHIIPAILAGNTVVFKPSELTPRTGEKIVALWKEVNLPTGVVNIVQGGKEVGEALVKHPDVNGIFFTGSYSTGKAINELCAGQTDKILALEMGGNNPLIVTEVEDLKAAAYLTVQSAFITSGQRCVCARRLIVPQGDEFIKELLALTARIKVGRHTERPEPFMGPLISKAAAEKVIAAKELLVKNGGKELFPLKVLGDNPAMLSPVIIDVTSVKERTDEEVFGPLLQVIRVKDFEEAIFEANNTKFGLASGILTDNPKLYEEFWTRSRAGVVNWNRQTTGSSSEGPFGGLGQSGNHRPSAYFAIQYCAYPVASLEANKVCVSEPITPGIGV